MRPKAYPGAVRSPLRGGALLCLPVLGFWLPGLGLFASLALVLSVVPRVAPGVWRPGGGRRRGTALAGFLTMWLPAGLNFSGASHHLLGADQAAGFGSTLWLLVPLCAPEDFLAVTATASAVYAVGAVVSSLTRRAWPWVVGGLLSALSYDLTLSVLATEFLC